MHIYAIVLTVVVMGASILLNIENVKALKLDVGTISSTKQVIPPLTTRSAIALCPPGLQVTGGGHEIWEGNVIIVLSKSTLVNGQEGWMIEGFAPQGTGQGQIQAFAMCGKLIP
jgi:hypothetical protein